MGRHDQGITTHHHRWHTIPRVLCFLIHRAASGDSVLLLRGAPTKRIWPNKLNGLGGHVERDEDVYTAACREIAEEAGIEVPQLQLCGIIQIDSGAAAGIMMFVWRGEVASQQVTASPEGQLEWHSVAELPYAEMVEDLPQLLPRVLTWSADQPPLWGRYWYDAADRLCIAWNAPNRHL